ncbi:MAG: OmpA family protein [Casimicrobiaceae bacterium]
MRFLPWALPLSVLLGSCTSPPKPPSVDPASRRPANAFAEVEAQTCRSELQNSRILVHESARAAHSSSDAAARLAAQLRAAPSGTACFASSRNTVYTVLFAYGSSHVTLAEDFSPLAERARHAPLVVLSGRTDGANANAAESRIARERAEAVQSWLVQSGVDAARIRTTWQPVGDHAADNTSAAGRRLTRRVEVEIYEAAPQLASITSPPGT